MQLIRMADVDSQPASLCHLAGIVRLIMKASRGVSTAVSAKWMVMVSISCKKSFKFVIPPNRYRDAMHRVSTSCFKLSCTGDASIASLRVSVLQFINLPRVNRFIFFVYI